jgi:hypothetical protein
MVAVALAVVVVCQLALLAWVLRSHQRERDGLLDRVQAPQYAAVRAAGREPVSEEPQYVRFGVAEGIVQGENGS